MIKELNIFESMLVKFKFLKAKFLKIFLVDSFYNAGLIPRTGPLPSTRRLWPRPTGTFERNGAFNIHTHNFNTRFIMPFLFGFLIYGWWGHTTYGLYKSRYEDNGELPGNMYDKLNTRVPPASKIWLRPG
jgi:hypothetical protein